MLKKTLLATAIAGFACGSMAADIDVATDTDTYSSQGAASFTSFTAPDVVVQLGAEYKAGDVVTFQFTTALDAGYTPASTINVAGLNPLDSMVLGLLNYDAAAGTVVYRVTELNYDAGDADTTIGGTATVAGVKLVAAEVLAEGGASVTYSAVTDNNYVLDQSGDLTADIITLIDQFAGVTDTDLDATIDVEQQRLQFVDADVVDTFSSDLTDDVASVSTAATAATVNLVTYTLKGDFSFLDTDADTDGVQAHAGAVTLAGDNAGAVVSVSATEIVYTDDAITDITVTIDADGASDDATALTALSPQSFTLSATLNYSDSGADQDNTVDADDQSADEVLFTDQPIGAWGLNGSQITFPYAAIGYNHAPYNIYTSFEISNSGNQVGEIQVDAFDQDGVEYSATLGTVAEDKTVTRVSTTDLEAAFGIADANKKLTVTFTINAPEDDIRIYGYQTTPAGRTVLDSSTYEGK